MRHSREFYKQQKLNTQKLFSERYSDFKVEVYKRYEFWTWTGTIGSCKDKPILRVYTKNSSKPISEYYYRSIESRNDVINKFKTTADQEEQRKLEKKMLLKSIKNPFKLGDILYDSWGYGQTNIDFYQVVGLTPKGIKIQKINKVLVEDTGFLQGNVVPRPNEFQGKTMTKRLQTFGEGQIYIKSEFGSFSKWNGKPVWSSWYY